MRGNPQEKNARTRRITELCSKHKRLCNFHDRPVHPYGQMRTWQEPLIQDGVHGHYQTSRETLRVENRQVPTSDTLRLKLAPGGGTCVILEPIGKEPGSVTGAIHPQER